MKIGDRILVKCIAGKDDEIHALRVLDISNNEKMAFYQWEYSHLWIRFWEQALSIGDQFLFLDDMYEVIDVLKSVDEFNKNQQLIEKLREE